MFFGKRFHGHHRMGLSGLDILVLSLIKSNARISGYDLGQIINEKYRGMWRASAGTIYPLLNRLAEKGYLTTEEIVENNRQKKLYSITEAGTAKLKEVLEDNLRVSIDTIQEYIKTITKAIPPIARSVGDCFCGMPVSDVYGQEKINKSDYSMKNIERVEAIIGQLERDKTIYSERLENVDKQLEHYNKLLEILKTGRDKYAKTVEIVDDDSEFGDF